jgi:hypothetical protein
MNSKEVMIKMAEIEARNPLTIDQILSIDMVDYKKKVHTQAIAEINGIEPTNL